MIQRPNFAFYQDPNNDITYYSPEQSNAIENQWLSSPEGVAYAAQTARQGQISTDPLYQAITRGISGVVNGQEGYSPWDQGNIEALYNQVKAGGAGLDANSDWTGLMQNMQNRQFGQFGNWSHDSAQVVPKFWDYNGLDPNRTQINNYLSGADYREKQGLDDWRNAMGEATPTGGLLGAPDMLYKFAAMAASMGAAGMAGAGAGTAATGGYATGGSALTAEGARLASAYGGGAAAGGVGAGGYYAGLEGLYSGGQTAAELGQIGSAGYGSALGGSNMGFFNDFTGAWEDPTDYGSFFDSTANGSSNGGYNDLYTPAPSNPDWQQFSQQYPELAQGQGSLTPWTSPLDSMNWQDIVKKYGVDAAKLIASKVLGGSGAGGAGRSGGFFGGTNGGSIFDTIMDNPMGAAFNATPFLLALQQANAQKNSINPYLSGINNLAAQSQGNNGAYMKAITDPYNAETGRGMSSLNESLLNRGVAGSSFGDQSVTNYNLDRSLGLGDLTAKAQQGSMGLTADLFNKGASLQNASNTNTNLLLGAGLNASGQLFGKQNDPNAWMANLFKAAA